MPETIGEDPLDTTVPKNEDTEEDEGTEDEEDTSKEETEQDMEQDAEEGEEQSSEDGSEDENGTETVKERMTVHVPVDIKERIKNAVYWTPGLTISDVATEGLLRVIEQLEEENGGEFEDREQELKGGRPMK